MSRLPTLFLSHGSPMMAIDGQPAHHFLKAYGAELPKPKAILIVSAHWETNAPEVSTAPRPKMIYDFGGFDTALHRINYPAPGAPDVARRALTLLDDHGIEAREDAGRGYDHGVWVPLHLLYPAADVPVAQLSMQPMADPAHHYRLGRALRPLRDEGVMIIGSGAMTHNLRAFFTRRGASSSPEAWVTEFTEWMRDKLETGDVEALLDYRRRAPSAERNHPADEHLLPLYVALGAAYEDEPVRRVHASIDAGVIAMDCYRFG